MAPKRISYLGFDRRSEGFLEKWGSVIRAINAAPAATAG